MDKTRPEENDEEFDAQLDVLADIIIDSYLDKLKREKLTREAVKKVDL